MIITSNVLPQELVLKILYKYGGLEHPTAKMIKEYFTENFDDFKKSIDRRQKNYDIGYVQIYDDDLDDEDEIFIEHYRTMLYPCKIPLWVSSYTPYFYPKIRLQFKVKKSRNGTIHSSSCYGFKVLYLSSLGKWQYNNSYMPSIDTSIN